MLRTPMLVWLMAVVLAMSFVLGGCTAEDTQAFKNDLAEVQADANAEIDGIQAQVELQRSAIAKAAEEAIAPWLDVIAKQQKALADTLAELERRRAAGELTDAEAAAAEASVENTRETIAEIESQVETVRAGADEALAKISSTAVAEIDKVQERANRAVDALQASINPDGSFNPAPIGGEIIPLLPPGAQGPAVLVLTGISIVSGLVARHKARVAREKAEDARLAKAETYEATNIARQVVRGVASARSKSPALREVMANPEVKEAMKLAQDPKTRRFIEDNRIN